MQIAGASCQVCGIPVSTIRDGLGCGRCASVVHVACVATVRQCPTCGGPLETEANLPRRPGAPSLASRSSRLAGQVLDSLFAAIALVIGLTIGEVSEPLAQLGPAVGVAFFVAYYLFADGMAHGQSWGKRVVKTAVVNATTGEPCTLARSFVRNASLMALAIFDWVFIFGAKRQRLGDMLANTIVIEDAGQRTEAGQPR